MVSGFPELVYQATKKDQGTIEIPLNAISLDLLQAVYRCNELPLHTRMRAAMATLPHEVPRLAVTAQVSDQDFATLLDQRIARYENMKLLDAKPAIEATRVEPPEPTSKPHVEVETKPPLARTPDRR